jgi:sec-independent protein translocase protein TatA
MPSAKGLGTTEVIILAIVVIVLFGTKRVPEFIKYFGKAIKEFRKAVKED